MNEDRLRDLLRYRMRQADDSLREAGILRDADAQRRPAALPHAPGRR